MSAAPLAATYRVSPAQLAATRAPATARRLLALIILIACLLAAGCWRVYSNTWDEPEHLAAGIELLDRGKYEYDTEHPPFARVFLAVGPYLTGAHSYGTPPPEGTPEGLHILYAKGAYWRDLTLARLGMLPFLALLLTATWLWARRLLPSEGAALLAVVLLVSVPPVLGNAALASLDVAAAATILLALYALQRWLVSALWRDAVLFGLASGLAVVTKFSSVPFIGGSLIVLAAVHAACTHASVTRAARARDAVAHDTLGHHAVPRAAAAPPRAPPQAAEHSLWRTRLEGLALAALVGLLPVWIAYGPRAPDPAGVAFRFNWAVSYLLQQHGAAHVIGVVLSHLWLPRELKDLVNGIVAVKAHNDNGHLSYLLGEVRRTGWWYFYLVALAVKTPIPLLLAGPVGLGWLAVNGWRRRESWLLAPLAIAVSILVFASAVSRINIGIRHILILYPLFALGGAYLTVRAWRALRSSTAGFLAGRPATEPVSSRVRQLPDDWWRHPQHLRLTLAAAVLLAALVWQLSPLWRAYPDYLPYFNETVAHPERVLVDSDLDWGQDLHRLELRVAQLRIGHLNLAYRGSADLRREPLPQVHILAPRERVTGWVALSELARTRNLSDYAWLDAYRPIERVGKTIDLYYVP
ncbi:MAG TPA: glycosyltransferase family 39 protein [Steroidobacteraceae bacterium]|nr:glycosyltransferase family 39 protein [Steroidobacteraceae bacterium]